VRRPPCAHPSSLLRTSLRLFLFPLLPCSLPGSLPLPRSIFSFRTIPSAALKSQNESTCSTNAPPPHSIRYGRAGPDKPKPGAGVMPTAGHAEPPAGYSGGGGVMPTGFEVGEDVQRAAADADASGFVSEFPHGYCLPPLR
jgi:hypothetical protein